MLIRRALLSLLGALLLFVWGFIGHVALGLYNPVFQHFEDETAVAAMLDSQARGAGIHYLPAEPARDGSQAEAFINYVPAGERGSFGSMIARDVLIDFVVVFLVLGLIGGSRRGGYIHRVSRFTLVGLALGLSMPGYFWIWFDFPGAWFLRALADNLIAWTLVGLALSGFTNERPGENPGRFPAPERSLKETRR